MNLGIAICVLKPTESGGFQILPAGQFRSSDGRPSPAPYWQVKDPVALLAKLLTRKNDLLVDYEHATLKKDGSPNPAAGWIKPSDIEWTEDGLFAKAVAWTARAKSYIADCEIRYTSPVFSFDKVTGEVLDLLHIALTNDPALDGMQGVIAAASRAYGADNIMPNPELLKSLGLPPEADDAAVLKAVEALKSSVGDQTAQADCAKKNHDLLLASISEVNASVAKNQEQLAALVKQNEVSERQVLIAANSHKFTASLKAWAENIEIAVLKKFLESAPDVVPASLQTDKTPPPDTAVPELSKEEIAFCSRMGLTKDEYLKGKTNGCA